ncbi:MAG: phosphoglycolate phosphatase-like HAD superfamily hydrolase [Gammaproteobacteria bacterium]|jgi:phosphoglycolate phosphatase-like HAD superfamily hydrolase
MLICFDYDGVIVDSLALLTSLCIKAQRGLGLGREPCAADFAHLNPLTFDALAKEIGIPARDAQRFAEGVFALQAQSGAVPSLCTGIGDVVSTLSEQHVVVVITASDASAVYAALDAHGLAGPVESVLGAELGLSKAQRIVHTMDRLGFSVAQSVMVGDARSDIHAGQDAGVHTVAVTWGFQPASWLNRASPTATVSSPSQLLGLFAAGANAFGA